MLSGPCHPNDNPISAQGAFVRYASGKVQKAFIDHVRSADVYERLTPKGGRAPFYAMLITQTVSAVWHGLFPGYGIFFITSAFMFEASKVVFRYERAFAPSKGLFNHKTFPPWVVLKWAFTAFVLNYAAATFLVSFAKHDLQVG